MPDERSSKRPVPKTRSAEDAGAAPGSRKIEAKAIARILDAKTQEIVGHLYKWNTGQVQPKWKDDIERDYVIYRLCLTSLLIRIRSWPCTARSAIRPTS